MSGAYVHYGCGLDAPAGWINFDASLTLRYERIPFLGRIYTRNASRFPQSVRYGDIVAGLPISDGSCAAIYCSHVLEHLTHDDAQVALANTYAYLRPGGIFRIVVPDLRMLAEEYLKDPSPQAAHVFMEASGLGRKRSRAGLDGKLVSLFGNSEHLWMWDERSLTDALAKRGFVGIRRCAFGDASDPAFRHVENQERFVRSIALEARR